MNISALIWLCIYLSESFIYLTYLYKVDEDVYMNHFLFVVSVADINNNTGQNTSPF